MIIVDQINPASLAVWNFYSKYFGKIYTLGLNSKLVDSQLSAGIKFLPIDSVNLGGYLKIFGVKNDLEKHASLFLPSCMLAQVTKYFRNIVDFESKIYCSFISSSAVQYRLISLAAICGDFSNDKTIFYVHTSLFSYLRQSNGVNTGKNFVHLYSFVDDLLKLLQQAFIFTMRLVELVKISLSSRQFSVKIQPSGLSINHSKNIKNTAIIFHKSLAYGNLYLKDHYFSDNKYSRLHRDNVLMFVLDPDCMDQAINQQFINLKKKSVSTLRLFGILLDLFIQIRSFRQISGALFLIRFYFTYLSWDERLLDYPYLKNVIIDYDILFPKTLSLALESNNIKTIALQERAIISFLRTYGVIVTTYLSAGGIYSSFANENPLICCDNLVDYGQYRSVHLLSSELYKLWHTLSLTSFSPISKSIHSFDKVIACYGLFSGAQTDPIINPIATFNFFEQIIALASCFPHAAVVIRMKILITEDVRKMQDLFSGFANIYLLDDYSIPNLSYALGIRADVVVSLPSSIADECLAARKKVVFLNSTHNLTGILTDVYPEIFHFCTANDVVTLLGLVSDCISMNRDLDKSYNLLWDAISPGIHLNSLKDVSNSLEFFLQS